MQKYVPAVIGVAVFGVILAAMSVMPGEPKSEVPDEEWIASGPFSINSHEYRLGEKIFISVSGLAEGEAGKIRFTTPGGILAYTQEFNGSKKCCFNVYWEPDTSRTSGILQVQDLVGMWTMSFDGAEYFPIHFKVTEEWVEGAQDTIRDIEGTVQNQTE